jgi:hypothetical protein
MVMACPIQTPQLHKEQSFTENESPETDEMALPNLKSVWKIPISAYPVIISIIESTVSQ